jgi:hypothetical protein
MAPWQRERYRAALHFPIFHGVNRSCDRKSANSRDSMDCLIALGSVVVRKVCQTFDCTVARVFLTRWFSSSMSILDRTSSSLCLVKSTSDTKYWTMSPRASRTGLMKTAAQNSLRRPWRRDPSRLSNLGPRRGFLRLALLLLGADGGRSGTTGFGAVAKAMTPDYALGGHTASLGLCWMPAGTLPGFPDGMAIGQHGSWNRSTLSGYKVVFVPFANGRPSGPPRGYSVGVPCTGRAGVLWPSGRRQTRSRRLYSGGRRLRESYRRRRSIR